MNVRSVFMVCMGLALSISVPGFAGDSDRNAASDKTVKKQRLLELVNDARAKGCNCGNKYYGPAPAVTWNDKLEAASADHSQYMQMSNVLSHTGQNGSNAGQRITAAGYKWSAYGENVAVGYKTEEEVIAGWLKSPGHCKNLMNSSFNDMAVSRSGSYWTQVLAAGQ